MIELQKYLAEYWNIFKCSTGIETLSIKNISYILGQSNEQMYYAIIKNIIYNGVIHLFIRLS